jgi:phage-related protein
MPGVVFQMTIKAIEFRGSSLADLRGFPVARRREAGYELDRVQHGLEPTDWRPMPSVGAGVNEIRMRDLDGFFRVFYVAKFKDCVYVLHCFQKKSPQTSKLDIELGSKRYRELLQELRS